MILKKMTTEKHHLYGNWKIISHFQKKT
jgi:hypothetical protein